MTETTATGTHAIPVPRTAGEPITVALIEDNRLVREGITLLLNQTPDIRVVVKQAAENIHALARVEPQVVLLDVGLRQGYSLRIAAKIKEEFPGARVIMMDLLPSHEDIVEFVNAGVAGFIMKDATLDDLAAAIRTVAAGFSVLPPKMVTTLFSQIAGEAVLRDRPALMESVRMTPREQQVVHLITEGLSNKEIAARLHVATHTVKSHVRNVMEKLTLRTRLQIAAFAKSQSER
jgi:DNA-binding NarL/FixJ family response regulator